MNKEIWKDIKGYEGIYQISNFGKVKSIKKGIIKKPSILPKGYLRIGLSKNGVIKYYSIHRLVAEAFIPNPQNKPCVNHKDCDTSNNNVDNLEWITYIENNNYMNHNLKKSISNVIHFLKRDYPNEKELISNAEKLKESILTL